MEEVISLGVALRNSLSSELLIYALGKNPGFRITSRVDASKDLLGTNERMDVVLLGTTSEEAPKVYLATLQRLRSEMPWVKPVVLFTERDAERVVDVFRFGARGVISVANTSFDMLCHCVKQIYAGQIWANSEEQGWMVEALNSPSQHATRFFMPESKTGTTLSRREEEVVALLMNGLSNRDIADKLKLSEHTVRNCFFRIFEKVGVSNRNELLIRMIRSSWPGRNAVGDGAANSQAHCAGGTTLSVSLS